LCRLFHLLNCIANRERFGKGECSEVML